ncbi:MAG: hypothetical protein KJ000_04885 [Pirellulaceae bacterium]|nr:hypothetical protein [Pirellulaceae bacterium]
MPAVWDYLGVCFSGANLPASVVLLVAIMYWLLAIVAGLDLDFLDFDLNMDGQADLGEVTGMGVVILRFLNIGLVPLVIWGSILAINWWMVSMLLDRLLDNVYHAEQREVWFNAVQWTIRNLAIAVVLTKIFTQPLRGKFDAEEPNTAADLIGRTCRIVNSEVTERFGQAEYATEAAPLILNVRTRGTALLNKGDTAVIVDFDPERNIFFVEKEKTEV